MSIATLPITALLSLLLSGVAMATARAPSHADREIVLLDGRLRSAEIMRIAQSSPGARLPSPRDWDRQLVRHFDAVLGILQANTERSLSVALIRLEQHQGQSWSDVERGRWYQILAISRRQNIARLRGYQRRGRFPQNEHDPHLAIPIFVDRHDTACAVGYLMRASGREAEVARIAQADNFVYVSDVVDGPVVDWVLRSGLTREEAILIQPTYNPPNWPPQNPPTYQIGPTYSPPPQQANLSDLLEPGASLTRNGLRFDNFSFGEVQNPDLLPDIDDIGVSANDGPNRNAAGVPYIPTEDTWMFFGGSRVGRFGNTAPGQSQTFSFGYDVTAADGIGLIDRAHLASYRSLAYALTLGGGCCAPDRTSPPGNISLVTNVYDADHILLGSMHYTADGVLGIFTDQATLSFPAQEEIHLETTVALQNGVFFSSLIHEFGVAVPEPSTLSLAVLAIVVLGGVRRRRRTVS